MLKITGVWFFLWVVCCPAWGDNALRKLLQGTPTTPQLSGLQVSTMQAGETADHFAFGMAKEDEHGILPLGSEHRIRVASISKVAVAIAILTLVEDGHFALDDDVSDLLGWTLRNPNFPLSPITVRSLLSHTSSVRDGDQYFIAAGAGNLRDFFDPNTALWDRGAHWAADPQERPGEHFKYANLNFGLLAAVIEKVSQQRFDLFMTARIFAPLGLIAGFNPCDIPPALLATTYRKRNAEGRWDTTGPWRPQVDGAEVSCFYGMHTHPRGSKFLDEYVLGSNATLFSPQGGLRASTSDLLMLLKILANGGSVNGTSVLEASSVKALLSPVWTLDSHGGNGVSSGEAEPGGHRDGLMTSYGLSIHRINMGEWGFEDSPTLLLGHLGRAYGVFSFALYDPVSRDGIAAIVTGVGADPFKSPGHSPLTRVEEEILHWWLSYRVQSGRNELVD